MLLELLNFVSVWTIPAALVVILTAAYARGVRVYEVFCDGAKEGFETAVAILPYLVAMFVAVGVFRASGALDAILAFASLPLARIGIPSEVLPLALLRPLSGSGALGYVSDLLGEHGPDSFIGMMASTIQGSTETTFYVLTVYFGSIRIVRTRHAVAAGLLADIAGFIASVWIVTVVFGGS